MSIRIISNILVLGSLCLALNLSRQAKIVHSVPTSPAPINAKLLIPEKALLGEYCIYHMLGSQNLELKRDHRFSYRSHGRQGRIIKDQGTWEMQGDILVLHPELKASRYLSVRLIPLIWEKELYLVDENEMSTFCHYRFIKDPFGIWGHFGKALPEKSKARNFIPQRFRHFLEHDAIHVRVASVDSEKVATLVGADVARLQPGMHLCWRDGKGSGKCELRITEVGPEFAKARQVAITSKYDTRVRPGEIFTTGGGGNIPVGTGMVEEE